MKGITYICTLLVCSSFYLLHSCSSGHLNNDNRVIYQEATEHSYEEIIAQALCQAAASPKRNDSRRIFAVGRRCLHYPIQTDSCTEICASDQLHAQEFLASGIEWYCVTAYHVHRLRPSTNPWGTKDTATLGLKSRGEYNCDDTHCGPNFCCCEYIPVF